MKKLRWAEAAAGDLEAIAAYLTLHHPEYAARTIERLYAAALSLKKFPQAGRPGRKPGTRELVLAPLPYVLVYAVVDQWVHILRYLHTSREPR